VKGPFPCKWRKFLDNHRHVDFWTAQKNEMTQSHVTNLTQIFARLAWDLLHFYFLYKYTLLNFKKGNKITFFFNAGKFVAIVTFMNLPIFAYLCKENYFYVWALKLSMRNWNNRLVQPVGLMLSVVTIWKLQNQVDDKIVRRIRIEVLSLSMLLEELSNVIDWRLFQLRRREK